ncbi:MAG: helix-turn-helix transcriptional regulator [Waterburya sp.]
MEENRAKILGQKLKLFREQKELTQSELAQKVRYDRSTIAKFEAGTRTPDAFACFSLCKALDADFKDFF